jgi:hypothetical protein
VFTTREDLYASCDASGVVAILDPLNGAQVGSIDVGSRGNHMIAMLPDGSKLYSENEDQGSFVSVMDPHARKRTGEIPIPIGRPRAVRDQRRHASAGRRRR